MNSGLKLASMPSPLRNPRGNRDCLDRIVDAFRSHGHNFHTLAVPDIVGDSTGHGGGITFCGDFQRHDSDQTRLLLPRSKLMQASYNMMKGGCQRTPLMWSFVKRFEVQSLKIGSFPTLKSGEAPENFSLIQLQLRLFLQTFEPV